MVVTGEVSKQNGTNPLTITYEDHDTMDSLYESLKEREVEVRTLSRFAWVTCKNNLHVLQTFNDIKVKIQRETDAGNYALFSMEST